MRIHRLGPETEFQFPWRRAAGHDTRELTERDALKAQLQAALAREKVLLRERVDLSQRQGMLAQEMSRSRMRYRGAWSLLTLRGSLARSAGSAWTT